MISYYYGGDEEVVDELWNIKYAGSYGESPENVEEIINTVVHCNVSERIWSHLLDRFGEKFGLKKLLLMVVKSYAPNAPKVADMILHRCHVIIKEDVSSACGAVFEAACNEGDWAAEIMQVLLKYGGHPYVVNSAGYTPVHRAAQNESSSAPKIVRLLLQYGANPNSPSIRNGITPVHLAALNQGDYAVEILKQLLDSGGTCNAVENPTLFEPIHFAAINSGDSALELLQLLLGKRGIDVIGGQDEWTLLHFAMVNEGDCGPKILKNLLESGMNPNVVDKHNRTPLHLASGSLNLENQNIVLVRDLLENGGDPNAVDEEGLTPVHCAARDGGEHGYEKLKLLFLYEGNVSINGTDGLTPLHCAILKKENSGSMTRGNIDNDEAKQRIATKNNQINRVQLILDNGGNPNAQDSLGDSPVHLAVIQNNFYDELDILQLLLKNGGNPNLLDQKQFASIHFAADSFSETAPEMMKILLEYGGDPNLNGGEDGLTPLHMACVNSKIHGPTITRILLENGGSPNALDLHKRTPLHSAIQLNKNDHLRLETIKLLLEKGANPNAGDILGKTPVHCVVLDNRSNSFKVLKLLLENGGNILQKNNFGTTPHRLATQIGSKQYCQPEVKKLIVKTYRKMK